MKVFGYMNGYLSNSPSSSNSTIPNASTAPDESSAPCTSNQIKETKNNAKDVPQQSSSEPRQVDEVFVVERILDKKLIDGIAWYKIKWKDYDNPEDDTWEPIDNCHCIDLIKQYEDEHKDNKVEIVSTSNNNNKQGKIDKRGRKRKFSNNKNMSNGVMARNENDPNQIPFVEKDEYYIDEDGLMIDTILGFSKLPLNSKLMALVCYSDGRIEYIPIDLLKKHEKAKDCLIDFFIQRVQFID